MTPTEALKQARELLVRAEIALRLTNEDEFDELAAAARLVRADLRAFLALPSPVEEGTWNEAVEACAKVADGYANLQEEIAREKALDAPMSSATHEECAYVGLNISRRIRALLRDTSKLEEKRYTLGEFHAALHRVAVSICAEDDMVMDEEEYERGFARTVAALTGEKP